jgi:predicted esterase
VKTELIAVAVTVLFWGACSSASGPGGTVLHDLHQTQVADPPTLTADFYALPFPNDVRMDADGTIDLSLYPRVGGLLGAYVDDFDRDLTGFGTNSGVFFRLDVPLDPATLPADAGAATRADATAFVVDVTPGSPTYGQRAPMRTHFAPDGGEFIGPNAIALLPFPGIPLREKTTYAAVLTDGLRAADGGPLKRAPDFDAAMQKSASPSSDPRIAAAQRAYAPLLAWLDALPSKLVPRVIGATVFTTQDTTSEMARLRQVIYDQVPAPALSPVVKKELNGFYQVYESFYYSPNFQTGDPPYTTTGGAIEHDSAGMPIVQRIETLRVAMTVPINVEMPADGWPVVIYAHGTGGDYRSFIRDKSALSAAHVEDADGNLIANLAMISIDQVLHGPRAPAGTNVELAFFNFQNPVAGVANVKQGALDDYQLLRLVKSVDGSTTPFKFDPKRIYFKGHSQGGLTGPLFLAAEPEVNTAVLSGAGAVLIESLLNKKSPVDISQVVSVLVSDTVIDEFHPFLSMVQMYFESSEPANYARLLFREPPAGFAPKSIFQSLGIVDTFAPIPDLRALSLAMGVQPVEPQWVPIDGLALAGQKWALPPQVGNVAGGAATGVVLQYLQDGDNDGHFVIFDVPQAKAQSNRFLATAAVTGLARLDPP